MKRLGAAGFLFSFAVFSSALAQTTNATLGGTVSDSTGALIPGVTVTATNTQTGIVSTSITNETGAYNFPSLQTGVYKVSAELTGFQTHTYNDVTLGVSQQVRLNFTLQVGSQAQSIEVSVQADTLIATTSASVGVVLPEYRIRDLPLATRNILDLIAAAPGVQGSNFAGGRSTQLNTTRDGIPVSDGRYDIGAATTTYVSPDLVDEVRIIVAPADAETGRGSGQIQMSTRSGTNEVHGSLFWTNRNSKLDANSWSNNFQGVGKDYYNGNQFGGRVGGPIIKNKTFFFFLFDGQRYVTKGYYTGAVLTEQARQGIFRYFPGVQNGNALANNPTVDRSGNPVTPAGATGPLTSINVFGRDVNGVFTPWDSNRAALDTSGWIKTLISRMPLPNDFTTCSSAGGTASSLVVTTPAICDGLNVAGHRWLRRVEGLDSTNGDGNNTDRNQYNIRIDHNFNSKHKASFSGTWERDWAMTTQAGIASWPDGFNGIVRRAPRVITGSFVSTLSPTIVNEFRFGTRKNWNFSWASFLRPDAVGDRARAALPTHNGISFIPQQAILTDNIISGFGGPATRGQTSPLFTYNDSLSWTKAKHAFKTGFEARFTSSRGWNGTDNPKWYVYPSVVVASSTVNPSVPVTGIATIPGLMGTNVVTAQNLLLDLSGSVSSVTLSNGFNVNRPDEQTFSALPRIKDFHQNEWAAFIKDDWKIYPSLTLNLGVRYDFYGVPWESNGMNATPAGLFGISGTSMNDLWLPGRIAGQPTLLQLVGKHSNHPDTLLYHNDWNNIGPAIGLGWSLPWGGKDKTVLRAGYGINYQGAASFNAWLNLFTGNNPGLTYAQSLTTLGLGARFFNFSSPDLPVPLPAPTNVKPLAQEPFDVRTNALLGFDDHRVNPYIQNFNVEIQRELARNLTLEARYIGSKGTHLYGGMSINDVNIFENGILRAFNITRAGGDSLLFDQMLNGITLNPGTNAGLGQGVVDGRTLTGSAALRANTIFKTFLANGNVGQFASALNTSPTVTGKRADCFQETDFPTTSSWRTRSMRPPSWVPIQAVQRITR
ncbi:MAG: hypothetical protein DMG15_22515 [Acidobacteria bacterium]|nr:MAG: hypothetical protein DMG15_22515 [Acidobacteriota bacterium]